MSAAQTNRIPHVKASDDLDRFNVWSMLLGAWSQTQRDHLEKMNQKVRPKMKIAQCDGYELRMNLEKVRYNENNGGSVAFAVNGSGAAMRQHQTQPVDLDSYYLLTLWTRHSRRLCQCRDCFREWRHKFNEEKNGSRAGCHFTTVFRNRINPIWSIFCHILELEQFMMLLEVEVPRFKVTVLTD